ncbi:MAG: HPr family phosphocarrier protein [Planctomycetota bacterium]|jgi:phosphotransferase system HPr (HPr) family protein|nr:HPr family phosphocarrier protein [Planctomycetota bacterium]
MAETLNRYVTIRHKFGIHARPAAKIVSLCNTFLSDIRLLKTGEPPANAKNILDIMMLAAAPGVKLEIRAQGPDAQAAIEQLGLMLESDFEVD